MKRIIIGSCLIGLLLLIHEVFFIHGVPYNKLATSSGFGFLLGRYVWCFVLGFISMKIAAFLSQTNNSKINK